MTLTVGTYNFYCRPRWLFKDNQVIRANAFAEKLKEMQKMNNKQIDILCLQEIIDNKTHKILKKELKSIGFVFKTKRLDCNMRLNGGIIIYSRLPIIEETNMLFDKNGIVSKGAVCIKVKDENNNTYDIVNTHLDPFHSSLRKNQLKNIKSWLDKKNLPETDNIIVCGDFNIPFYSSEKQNIDDIFNYKYAKSQGPIKYSLSSSNDWVKRRITSDTDPDKESLLIDYFIYQSNTLINANMEIINLKLSQKAKDIYYSTSFYLNLYSLRNKIKVNDLSDHYMVISSFEPVLLESVDDNSTDLLQHISNHL